MGGWKQGGKQEETPSSSILLVPKSVLVMVPQTNRTKRTWGYLHINIHILQLQCTRSGHGSPSSRRERILPFVQFGPHNRLDDVSHTGRHLLNQMLVSSRTTLRHTQNDASPAGWAPSIQPSEHRINHCAGMGSVLTTLNPVAVVENSH